MSNKKIRGIVKDGELRILDVDGRTLDRVRPLPETLELLQLKYGKKKNKK